MIYLSITHENIWNKISKFCWPRSDYYYSTRMLSNLELLWSIFLSFLPILVKFSEKVFAKNSFLQRCSAIVIKVTQDHSGASRILPCMLYGMVHDFQFSFLMNHGIPGSNFQENNWISDEKLNISHKVKLST